MRCVRLGAAHEGRRGRSVSAAVVVDSGQALFRLPDVLEVDRTARHDRGGYAQSEPCPVTDRRGRKGHRAPVKLESGAD